MRHTFVGVVMVIWPIRRNISPTMFKYLYLLKLGTRIQSSPLPFPMLDIMFCPCSLIGQHVKILDSDWLKVMLHSCIWLVIISCILSLIGQYALHSASDWSIYAWSLPLIGCWCWGHVWSGDIGVMSVMSMWSPRDAKWDIALMIHTESRLQ